MCKDPQEPCLFTSMLSYTLTGICCAMGNYVDAQIFCVLGGVSGVLVFCCKKTEERNNNSVVPSIQLGEQDILNRINLRKINLENQEVCCICLGTETEKEGVLTRCNHMYHESCILAWAKIETECPLCRETLLSQEIEVESCTPSPLVVNSVVSPPAITELSNDSSSEINTIDV